MQQEDVTNEMDGGNQEHGHGNPTHSSYHIIINARPREVVGKSIGYSQVVNLAFPNDSNTTEFMYSVHYIGPHMPDGTLAEDQSVKLQNGMKFHVSKTNRS